MKMTKSILLGLVALNAQSQIVTMFGAGLKGSISRLKLTMPNIVKTSSTSDASNGALGIFATSEYQTIEGKNLVIKSKNIYPIGGFARAGILAGGDNIKFGAMLELGAHYYFGLPKDRVFGSAEGTKLAEGTTSIPISPMLVTHQKGRFAISPNLAAAIDIGDIKVLLTAGLQLEYCTFTAEYSPKSKEIKESSYRKGDISKWVWGIRFGVEGIYQVTPCVGIGVGVAFVYVPEMGSKFNTKGKRYDFTGAKDDKDQKNTFITAKGTWNVSLNVAGYLTPGK